MLRHSFCSLHTGVRMHYVEALPPQGLTGETLLLVHGFPDSWYGWRKQIPELALAGHRVIVPDMRGYGETTPIFKDDASRYSTENLLGDLLALMDCLLLKKVVICGHDWGGTVVWNFALHYPDRCKGVAAFCTPFFPWRDSNPWPKMLDNPGRFDYQLYFHTREAEQELERDPEFTVKAIIRGTSKKDHDAISEYVSTPLRPTADGGYLVKIPRDVPKSAILKDNDVAYYAWQLKQSGFHGILSWYRNVPRNWRWNAKTEGLRVTAPSLMVTAANDVVLPPSMVKGMEPWFDDLTVQHVEDAGHWVLQEQPERVNSLLISWLASKFPPRKVQSAL